MSANLLCFDPPTIINLYLHIMANSIRSEKSASNWTNAELVAYNIAITPTSPAAFFQSDAEPSLGHSDPVILTSTEPTANPNFSATASRYLRSLALAITENTENYIDNLADATLKLLDFEEEIADLVPHLHPHIPLIICSEKRHADPDISALHHTSKILFIAVEDKKLPPPENHAEARLVAEAIAAFQLNNKNRKANGREFLDAKFLDAVAIPGITMAGTIPTFYLVPVTRQLSEAVKTAQYPPATTLVMKCDTVLENQTVLSDGMWDPEFRQLGLKRFFLAFKSLARRMVYFLFPLYDTTKTDNGSSFFFWPLMNIYSFSIP